MKKCKFSLEIGVFLTFIFCVIAIYISLKPDVKSVVNVDNFIAGNDLLIPQVSNSTDSSIEVLDANQVVGSIKNGKSAIVIPSLGIEAPIFDGVSNASLRSGVGKFDCSCKIGKKGNLCLAGHSSVVYDCIFNNLCDIKYLDEIDCYNNNGKLFKYYVTNTRVVSPSNVEVLEQTYDATITIVTCSNGGSMRFIVTGKLLTDKELSEYRSAEVPSNFSDNFITNQELINSMIKLNIADYLF